MTSVSQEFVDYGYFSVRVDRFYNAVNIYGMHHQELKAAYRAIPSPDITEEALHDKQTNEIFRRFAGQAISSLNYMATTGIFANAPDLVPGEIPGDILNFAFYTCFCFQWTLFENFTKDSLRRVITAGVLPSTVSQHLEDRWYRTKQFLDYIESGVVFGHTPFVTTLPVAGWVPAMETCSYADLDAIRDMRNSFIHGVGSPEIIPSTAAAKQKLYERSMWILRQFASNIDREVVRLTT